MSAAAAAAGGPGAGTAGAAGAAAPPPGDPSADRPAPRARGTAVRRERPVAAAARTCGSRPRRPPGDAGARAPGSVAEPPAGRGRRSVAGGGASRACRVPTGEPCAGASRPRCPCPAPQPACRRAEGVYWVSGRAAGRELPVSATPQRSPRAPGSCPAGPQCPSVLTSSWPRPGLVADKLGAVRR